MPLPLDAPATAQLAAPPYGVAWLVDLDFSSGALYFTTAPVPVVANGHTYGALGTLAEVGGVQESADSAGEKLSLSLSIANNAMLAAAMGDAAVYRGRSAQLWLQIFDAQWQPAGAPRLRWRGYMDKLQISRQPAGNDGSPAGGHIEMQCSRAGMARARRAAGLRLTDAQQQARYPGDTGLRYVRTLIEQPSRWLSKKFQEV